MKFDARCPDEAIFWENVAPDEARARLHEMLPLLLRCVQDYWHQTNRPVIPQTAHDLAYMAGYLDETYLPLPKQKELKEYRDKHLDKK